MGPLQHAGKTNCCASVQPVDAGANKCYVLVQFFQDTTQFTTNQVQIKDADLSMLFLKVQPITNMCNHDHNIQIRIRLRVRLQSQVLQTWWILFCETNAITQKPSAILDANRVICEIASVVPLNPTELASWSQQNKLSVEVSHNNRY